MDFSWKALGGFFYEAIRPWLNTDPARFPEMFRDHIHNVFESRRRMLDIQSRRGGPNGMMRIAHVRSISSIMINSYSFVVLVV